MGHVRLPGHGCGRTERRRLRPHDVGGKRQARLLRNRQLHLAGLCGPCGLPGCAGIARGRIMVFLQQHRSQLRQTEYLQGLWRHPPADLYGGRAIHQPLPHLPRQLHLRQPGQVGQGNFWHQKLRQCQPLQPPGACGQTRGELRCRTGAEPARHHGLREMPRALPFRTV